MSEASRMTGDESEHELQRLLDEFGDRLRAGEAPQVEQYVAQLPARADELRELLTTVLMLERVEPLARTHAGLDRGISRIGEYEIERELGRGGMGVVFLARQDSLGRRVALKILPLQATLDPRFLQRFQREAKAAASLQHANIVPVYGVGEHEGLHYYAMQYVEGHALDRLVRSLRGTPGRARDSAEGESSVESLASALLSRELTSDPDSAAGRTQQSTVPEAAPAGPRPGPRASTYHRNIARLGAQVADALAYAHGRGVLHRDVKPSNLLMDADGRVWVADFGLCKTSEAEALTGTSDMIGTVAYMAPEQIDGRSDVRSDVYGLGITLYELLVLRPAFSGKDRAGLVRRVADTHPPRPRKLAPELPRDLEAIVLKATAKLPEERYGTAQALAQDLRLFLAGRPVAARPPNALHLLRLVVRRNRVMAATVVGALALPALLTLFYVRGLQEARDEQDRTLYQASVAAAAAAHNYPETARRHLKQAPEGLRRWEWAHLDAALDDSLQTWPGLQEELWAMEVTPDGRRMLFGGGSQLVVRELAEPARQWTFPDHYLIEDIAVRPDGLQAVSVGEQSMGLWSLGETPEEIGSRPPLPGGSSAVCYDLSGERVFLASRNGRLVCMDATMEHELYRLDSGHGTWIRDLTISPDGNLLISSSVDGRIQAWDLEHGRGRWLLGHESDVHSVDVAPDGSLLASGGADGSVRLWDLATGKPLQLWRDHTDNVRCVRFSPDGQWLVSASDDRTLRVWDIARRKPVRALQGHDFKVRKLAWLADGRILSGSYAGTIKAWDPQVTGGRRLLQGHIADLWHLSYDATGQRLVSTSRDGTVRVWDARTGRQLRVFVHSMPEWATFARDGTAVLAGYKSGEVLEWDVASGESTWRFDPPEGEGRIEVRLVHDPRRPRFYSSTHGFGVETWQSEGVGWTRVASLPLPLAGMVDVSPRGDYLAIGAWDGTCHLLQCEGLTPVLTIPGLGDELPRVRFSPDGAMLATGDSAGNVALWSVPGGERLHQFRVEPRGGQFNSQIWALDFSPDGERLACATENLGISLWDPGQEQLVSRLHGPGDGYVWVTFSLDGRSLSSPAWDGSIRVWDTLDVQERRALVLAELADPLAGEHALEGSFEGLLARTLRLLRGPEPTHEDVEQAYRLARGLYKEHYRDARALAALGESQLRRGQLDEARANLVAAVRLKELDEGPAAALLAVLALAETRLGNAQAARMALERAQALPGANAGEAGAFVDEAQAALAGMGGH